MTPLQMMLKVFPEALAEDREKIAAIDRIQNTARNVRSMARAFGMTYKEVAEAFASEDCPREAILRCIREEEEKEARKRPV